MKRELLTILLAFIPVGGCAGRMDADLLRARIREQSSQLSESQREIAKTRSELKQSQQEAEKLKAQLANVDPDGQSLPETAVISRLKIHTLASGGLNKDDQTGDDAVVIQFVPLDSDLQPVQLPGQIEIALIDPLLSEGDREIGLWHFTAEECRSHWTRGITSSGFQFTLPLDPPPQHANLVAQIKYQNSDQQPVQASHIIKVVVPLANSARVTTAQKPKTRPRPLPIQTVEEPEDFLPPVGEDPSASGETEENDWDNQDSPRNTGQVILHSSNWTDATIPQLR